MASPSAASSSESPGMQSSDPSSMPSRKAAEGPLRLGACRVTRCAAAPPARAGVTGSTAPLSSSPVQAPWQQLAPAAGTQ
eukprot:4576722-Prymnesium_polylepis.1